MELLRYLLYPFALVYGFIIFVRNKLFDLKLIKSVPFPIPIISIGNLVVGGSGKTPTVEYITRLLKDQYKIATLSRGYKRKSSGFHIVTAADTPDKSGDEPLQYACKFPEVTVSVDESRRHGIRQLMAEVPGLEAVILDDAFQHRYVKAGLSILVTDYHRIYAKDHILPVGRLREFASGSKRADIIVVSKTPKIFSPLIRRQLLEDLKPAKGQVVCFSYIAYDTWEPLFPNVPLPESEQRKIISILMVTGIAFPSPLEEHLRRFCSDLNKLEFADHRDFSEDDLIKIRDKFNSLPTRKKVIVTTEKDAMRLRNDKAAAILSGIPVYYLPIRFCFHPQDKEVFDSSILSQMK